jgi:ABC-type bacteriocin/lantibiotic exporter with double-glycine peptidase domain
LLKDFKNIFSVLNNKQKLNSGFLIILIILGSIIELTCLLSLYEIIKFTSSQITNSKVDEINFLFKFTLSLFSFNEGLKNLLFFTLFLYIFKFFYSLIVNFFQYIFINSVSVDLSLSLFKSYLNKDYSFFLKYNPSLLIRNTESEVGQFILGCLFQAISLITEISILLLIITALFLINSEAILIISLFFLIIIFVYFFLVKKILLRQGQNRVYFSEKIIKIINESFYGIKSLKIFNANNYFIELFKYNKRKLARANICFAVLSQLPKNALELICVAAVCIFFYKNISLNILQANTLSALGFFVIATFKIIPSITKIILALQNFRFSRPSTQIVQNEIFKIKNQSPNNQIENNYHLKDVNFKSTIKLSNLYFRYQDSKDYVLKNVNLVIKKGDRIGIIGETGSGKSTLIDIIIGLLNPTSGNVLVDGININRLKNNWLKKIGYVPQKIFLTDDTIKNNIAFGKFKEDMDIKKINKSMKEVKLRKLSKINRFSKVTIGQDGINLSGGQIQRIGIARCLYKKSDLFIFDESTNALDALTEEKIIQLIKKISKNKTLIIISHNVQNLLMCNKLFSLSTNGFLKKIR